MKQTIPSFLGFLFLMSTSAVGQVDYETEIQPIFNQNCVSCHGGTSGVTLSSYNAVMNSVGDQYGQNIVVPGDPDSSPLVDKIEPNPQFGGRMPQGGSLTSDQITLIRQWISEGANEVPTSNEIITELPEGYELAGNYPNPFNPVTNIQFTVPEAVSYQVKVFASHGALVEEVVGNVSAGTQTLNLSLLNQPSGIYIYQVFAINANQKYLLGSAKMTLIK